MSSPSSSSSVGKRKRPSTFTSANKPTSSTIDQLQPSSRDASSEDGESTAPDTESANANLHVAKKLRSGARNSIGLQQSQDLGEPSDTTEGSTDIANRVGRKNKKASGKAKPEGHDEVDMGIPERTQGMAPPPIGRLTDPVGYKTNTPPAGKPVRVYADGVFDLFHLGHMRQLEQAKKAFPDVYLLVGVTGDKETHKRKGLTVLSGDERAETVRHCKWVDEVIEDCPWIVTPEFLEDHKIDYVAHDDLPYGADEGDDIYKPIKEKGMFLVTQRTEGVSTTGIITNIVRDYEKYIARQFKRGTSRQELNVSWLKKNELDLKRHVQEIRDAVRSNWTTTGQELGKELRNFWQNSRPASPARKSSYEEKLGSAATSPTALQHISRRLEIPARNESPGPSSDFATGYTLGLMTRSRQTNRDSKHPSDSSSDDGEDKSPRRGRSTRSEQEQSEELRVDRQINAMMNEGSKVSGQ